MQLIASTTCTYDADGLTTHTYDAYHPVRTTCKTRTTPRVASSCSCLHEPTSEDNAVQLMPDWVDHLFDAGSHTG